MVLAPSQGQSEGDKLVDEEPKGAAGSGQPQLDPLTTRWDGEEEEGCGEGGNVAGFFGPPLQLQVGDVKSTIHDDEISGADE